SRSRGEEPRAPSSPPPARVSSYFPACSFLPFLVPFCMSLALDGDAPRLGLLGLGQRHAQHTVLELGLHLLGVDRRRQLEHPLELAEAALPPVPVALERLVELALAPDRHLIAVRHPHLHLVPLH